MFDVNSLYFGWWDLLWQFRDLSQSLDALALPRYELLAFLVQLPSQHLPLCKAHRWSTFSSFSEHTKPRRVYISKRYSLAYRSMVICCFVSTSWERCVFSLVMGKDFKKEWINLASYTNLNVKWRSSVEDFWLKEGLPKCGCLGQRVSPASTVDFFMQGFRASKAANKDSVPSPLVNTTKKEDHLMKKGGKKP